ncbi:MAG: hypothetical protein IKY83_11660 [Proteobacteria bacterium]|nr:hypothetical protein [Pseudomonadota bacterium]
MAYLDLELKEIEIEYIAPHVLSGTERIVLMLTVVRGARGKRKLLGEAFARTVYQPVIHFKVFDEVSVESLFTRFLQQLIHRGYRPIQYRERDLDDHLSSWKPCDLTGLDDTDLKRGEESAVDIGENFEDF